LWGFEEEGEPERVKEYWGVKNSKIDSAIILCKNFINIFKVVNVVINFSYRMGFPKNFHFNQID